MKLFSKNSKSIAAGSACRSFDKARTAKGLFGKALSIATLTASLAASLATAPALHAQSVSFAGTFTQQITVPASGLGIVMGVAVDGSGNIYIADNGNERIVKITPAGVQSTLVTGLQAVEQIALDGAGNLFIADPPANANQTGRLLKYSAAGVLTTMLSNLPSPEGVAVDYTGGIFVSDRNNKQIYELDINGNVNDNLPSAQGFFNSAPLGLAQDSIGDLFFTSMDGSVQAMTPLPNEKYTTGGLMYSWGPQYLLDVPFTGLNNPYGIAVDAYDNVYVADTVNNRVVELPAWGSQTTLPVTGLWSPHQLARDGAGNLYIADTGNKRVVEMEFEKTSMAFGAVNVCPSGQTSPSPCSNTVPVTFNVTASGTLGQPQVFTQGIQWTPTAKNTEFALASGSTCTGAVTAGTTCTVNVTFSPKYPGLRTGAVNLTDAYGDILATTLLSGVGEAPQIAFNQGTQINLNQAPPSSSLRIPVATPNPTSAVTDAAGNIFVAEANGTVMKFTGNGQQVVARGLSATLSLAVDGADNLYIADFFNNRVLKFTPKLAQSTVGSGLSLPSSVAVDGAGNVYIADCGNNRVVEVNAATAIQSTMGTGLNEPSGVAVDGLGDVYIADSGNHRVVEVNANGTQTAIGAGLSVPHNLTVDAAGDVYVADIGLDQVVEVTPPGSQITIGTGLQDPVNVALDGAGDVFIADYEANQIVEVQQSQPSALNFPSTDVGAFSAPQSVTMQNIGNQALTITGLTINGNFEAASGFDFYFPSGASFTLSIAFAPASDGSLSGSLVLTDNSLNSTSATQTGKLTGTGQGVIQAPNMSFLVPNQIYSATPFTVSATSNSPGAITYSVVSGPATISGNTVTLTGLGTVTLRASQAPYGYYTAAYIQASFTVTTN